MSLRAILWALHDAPTDDPQSTLVLVSLAENAHDNGRYAWPSVATIAAKARCSERTAHRRLRELEDAGLIRRGDQRAVLHLDPRYRPVVYDLGMHLLRGDSVAPLDESRGDRPGSPGVTPVADEPSLEPTTPPSPPEGGESDSPLPIDVAVVGATCDTGNMDEPKATPARRREVSDTDPHWSRFWSLYPRKLSKGAARRAWTRAIGKEDPEVLLKAVERFAGGVKDLAFCPYPATWLNQEKWLDEQGKGAASNRMTPPKKNDECPIHVGQWATVCRGCAADRIAEE